MPCADADAQTEPYVPEDCVSRSSVNALERQQSEALQSMQSVNGLLEQRLQKVTVESQMLRDLCESDRTDWLRREQSMCSEAESLQTDRRAAHVQIEQLERHFDGLCVLSQWASRRVSR